MSDEGPGCLLTVGVVVLLFLGASLLVCAGLPGMRHWDYCTEFLGFTTRVVDAVGRVLGR